MGRIEEPRPWLSVSTVTGPFEDCWPEFHSDSLRNVIHRGHCREACIHRVLSRAFVVLSMGRHCEYGTDINPCCTSGRPRSSATCAYSHTNHAWSKRSTRPGSRKCPSVGCLGCNHPRAYARCQRLTQTAPYPLGKAAYGYWAYAAGLKIPPSQFFAPAEEAPLFYLRALLHQRLSPRRRSHVPRSHRYRPSASLLTASPRNTHTTRS